jgi:phospholipid/cholesterol/gamma-HCH transport system substrate-binding protein
METKVNFALVGAFVLVFGMLLIGSTLWLASGGAFQKQYDRYLAIEDESVSGLNLNAPVKYNGVDVGEVREIGLDPLNPERVRLVFGIEHGTPVNVDTVAVLKTQGLTGIAYVELTGGDQHSALLRAAEPGQLPIIRTEPSLSARLENVLTTVLAKLDSTSNNINSLLSEQNQAAVTRILADLAAVTHTIAARRDTLDKGIASAAKTFDNGARLTKQLGPVIAQIGKSADAVEKMGNEAAKASASAGKTVDSVGADIQRFTRDGLPELQRLMTDLDALSASLRRLSEKTERDPASLLLGEAPVPPGPGEPGSQGVSK